MSDGRLRSRWQLPFAGRLARERDSTVQPPTDAQVQGEGDSSAQLDIVPWNHGSGWKENWARHAPLERTISGDENCQPSSNNSLGDKAPLVVVASPAAFVHQEWTASQNSYDPSGNSTQSDGVALSPGTQALLDVLHKSRTDSKQYWPGEEGHSASQAQRFKGFQDKDSTSSGSWRLSASERQIDTPSNPDLVSPDLSNAGSSEPECATAGCAPCLPHPEERMNSMVAQNQTESRPAAATKALVPSEAHYSADALQMKHPVNSATQSGDTKRSPDLLTEFLQLSLQPPSTADVTVRPVSTPTSEPELFHCQRLMVSALPTPPEDSSTTGRSGAVPTEEASGTAVLSLSTQWQCSTSTVWTLSPAPNDSELNDALHVSPLQMHSPEAGRDGHQHLRDKYGQQHACVESPKGVDSAASPQHQVPQSSPADYVSMHSLAQLLVPHAGNILQPTADVNAEHPEGTLVATSSSHATNSECPSLQNVPEVSAYMELPHSSTASTSDADSKTPTETSPLLVDFSHHRGSEKLESPIYHEGGRQPTQLECSDQSSFNEIKVDERQKSVELPCDSDSSSTKQNAVLAKHAYDARQTRAGASMTVPQECTPVARALCARSLLLSPPATGWSSANESEVPHSQSSSAKEAPGRAYQRASAGTTEHSQEEPPETIGADRGDVGASVEELQRSWTRLQMNTCDSAAINRVETRGEHEQVTARDWLRPALSLRPDKHQSEQSGAHHIKDHHHDSRPGSSKHSDSGGGCEKQVTHTAQYRLRPHASVLSPFQRAVLSNTCPTNESGARASAAPTQSQSPVHHVRLQGSVQARHESPQSPGLKNKHPGHDIEEVGTPPLSVRASSTLHELLKSGCGRNAQSAIREVLACLAAEERLLEEVTSPKFNSPQYECHEHEALHPAPVSDQEGVWPQKGDSATDTSQSNDTILEASSQTYSGHQRQGDAACSSGAMDNQAAINSVDSHVDTALWDGEETVRVVASSCELNFPGTNAYTEDGSMPSRSQQAPSIVPQMAAPCTNVKPTVRTIQTKFSLVSGMAHDAADFQHRSQQMHLHQAAGRSPDRAPVTHLSQKKQLSKRKDGPMTKSGAPGRLGAATTAQLRSREVVAPTASKAPRSKVHPERASKVFNKQGRAQQSRSINASDSLHHDSMVEQPAWKPACGPLATSDTPRTRVSPSPQQSHLPSQVAPAAARPSKGPVKAKRTKKVKAKRKSTKSTLATHATAVSPNQNLGWEHVNGDDDVFFPGGGLQGLFGTKESRAATLAQIREVQAATAMAATTPLRQGRGGPGIPSRAGRSLSRSVTAAEPPRSGSAVWGRGRSSRQHENLFMAAAGADVPHALHAAAARMGCQLVRVQEVNDSAYQHCKRRGAPYPARACTHTHGTAEWPSATARWSPNECVFRSSKGGLQGQRMYDHEDTVVRTDDSDIYHDLSMQLNPGAAKNHCAGIADTNAHSSGTATPAATSSSGSTHAAPNSYAKADKSTGRLSGAKLRSSVVAGDTLRGPDQLVNLDQIPHSTGRGSGCRHSSEAGSPCDISDGVGDSSTWPVLQSCGLAGDAGFMAQPVVQFSAGQPGHEQAQTGRRSAAVGKGRRKLSVAELPSYGDKHRRTPRESVPHDGSLLAGFSSWIEVSFFSWRDAILQVPQCPGVYEWGALRHGCSYPKDIIAFYVGKAGTHFLGRGQATLASRFMRYVQMHDNFIGPARAGRECVKTQLFRYFQTHAFRLFFRWRQCIEPEEPADAEEALLATYDYPGNERANRGYRQVLLPDGKALHRLPKGGSL